MTEKKAWQSSKRSSPHRHHLEQLDQNAPAQYRCPISHEIMRDPVIIADGQTFERRDTVLRLGSEVVLRRSEPQALFEELGRVSAQEAQMWAPDEPESVEVGSYLSLPTLRRPIFRKLLWVSPDHLPAPTDR